MSLKQEKNHTTTKTTSYVLIAIIVQLRLKIPAIREYVDYLPIFPELLPLY